MKKTSVKRLSILGLVLMGASAVTAAVLPKDNNDSDKFAAASVTDSDGNGPGEDLTCELSDNTVAQACHITAGSGTTNGSPASSDGDADTTIGDVN